MNRQGQHTQRTSRIAAFLILGTLLLSCEQPSGPGTRAGGITWTATANGKADEETTTVITLNFDSEVPALNTTDIRLEQGIGRAFSIELMGSGQTWTLLIDVEDAGIIGVRVDRQGIDPGPRNVRIHKGAEAAPPEIIGITIQSPPDTTYYGRNMTFDTTGLVVAWLYSDGTVGEEIPPGDYEVIDEPDMARYSPQIVRVKAGEYETRFGIQVVNTDKILQSITVSGPTNKTQDFGIDFNKTGLVVTGTFSDGSTENLTSLAAIMGYDKLKRGPQTVTVKVNGKTASIEGISTRIGNDAAVTIYTGFGTRTTFIKGETLTAQKSNISFRVNPAGTPDTRELSLKNGGLTPDDFNNLGGYDPQTTGKQTVTITLDGRPFTFEAHVVDAEPDAWFDFGYMRHAGDPAGSGKGAGIDEGKYYARPNETLVIAPVRYLIGYDDDNTDTGATYDWTVSGDSTSRTYTTSNGGEYLHITPKTVGTYTVRVNINGRNYIDGSNITKTAEAKLTCYTGPIPAGGKTFTSPLRNFGAGQFTEAGTGYGWSLGSAGGYEVWKVDHQSSYQISGNPMTTWREPGVVWMQEDRNGNGLPDEMWYELPGSDETDHNRKALITRRYAITYFEGGPGTTNEFGQIIREVHWADSRGRAGMIPGGFPTPWGVEGNRVTFTTTLLRDDGVIFANGYNMNDLDGYVDCTENDRFPVNRAVKADGTPANLSAVKFLKVQTSMFRYGDIFGDVSTEINYADGLGTTTSFPKP
jgi:hypothetical protein